MRSAHRWMISRSDLVGLRTWRDSRAALIDHLRDDPNKPNCDAPPPDGWGATPHQQPASRSPRPLATGQRPPFDPEAT